jgi:hypothetical protein
MPGAGLTEFLFRKALSDMLALEPYWGKLIVRNFRAGDGDVGVIRSPVRAIALLDRKHGDSLGLSGIDLFSGFYIYPDVRISLACWLRYTAARLSRFDAFFGIAHKSKKSPSVWHYDPRKFNGGAGRERFAKYRPSK